MNAKIGREEQNDNTDIGDDRDTFFSSIDKLFDGTDEDKLKAYEMLRNSRGKVYLYALCRNLFKMTNERLFYNNEKFNYMYVIIT